jgi:hypothetical protein
MTRACVGPDWHGICIGRRVHRWRRTWHDRKAEYRLAVTQRYCRLSGKGDVMKLTDAEIEHAARRFERLADNLDPASVAPEDLSDLRAVAEAAERVRLDEALVTERVAAARARGRSWNRIAVALGVSSRPPATGSPTRSADPIPDRATKPPAIHPAEGAWR